MPIIRHPQRIDQLSVSGLGPVSLIRLVGRIVLHAINPTVATIPQFHPWVMAVPSVYPIAHIQCSIGSNGKIYPNERWIAA